MTGFRILRNVRKAPTLIRRFGVLQSSRLILPELARSIRLPRTVRQFLEGYRETFRTRDSTVLCLRPFSMDLGIFHEIWDHDRYTGGSIGRYAYGGTVVDIGAHIGLFSVYASRVLHARRIVSVEPNPENFQLLSQNISANHEENATLLNIAIADKSGPRQLYFAPSNTGGHSFYAHGASGRQVRAISLMELFRSLRISECSLLKLDCEGAEMEILESVPDELFRNVSAVSFEYHLDVYSQERLEKFRERIENLGFIVETRPTTKTLGILRGARADRLPEEPVSAK